MRRMGDAAQDFYGNLTKLRIFTLRTGLRSDELFFCNPFRGAGKKFGGCMIRWTRSVFLGDHDLQERLRAEIVLRWPEAQYPFHVEVLADEIDSAFEVHVWSDTGIHIFQEAIPKSPPSREDDATIAAVLHTVERALGEAASEKLEVNRVWPLRPKELL